MKHCDCCCCCCLFDIQEMYKLNEKVFHSASEALDHYIRDFQMCNDYKHVETSIAKSTSKQYRLDKLENMMHAKVKKPIFNNFIKNNNNTDINQLANNLTASTETSSFFTDRRDETSFEALNQVEKLISNLSTKVEDYKSDSKLMSQNLIIKYLKIYGIFFCSSKGGSLSLSKLKTDGSFSSLSSNSCKDFSNEVKAQTTDESDPIMRSIIKFEDLNKQLSSHNMFSKVQSSIPSTNNEDTIKTVPKPVGNPTQNSPKPFTKMPVIQTTVSLQPLPKPFNSNTVQALPKPPDFISVQPMKQKSPIQTTIPKVSSAITETVTKPIKVEPITSPVPALKPLFTPTHFEVTAKPVATENKLTAFLEVGPNSVNFVNECIKIIEGN